MNKAIPLGLLAVSVALIPIICHKKVLGKSELILQKNNQENISIYPGFGYLETRNGRIAINSNNTFTIYDEDGKVLSENISLEELKAQHPELHYFIKDWIAKPTLMMDAGIGINR